MRWLALSVVPALGCQIVFSLTPPVDAPPDGPLATGCSNIKMLGDDFSGPLTGNWVTSANTTNQVVQQVDDKISMTSMGIGDGALTGRFLYDLQNDAFTIDVTPDMPLPVDESFELRADAQTSFGEPIERITMGIVGGATGEQKLYGKRDTANQTFAKFTIDFDPVRDRIWRFARSGEDFIWSTGPTPQGPFTVHGSDPLPQYDFVRFGTNISGTATGPISITLDDAVGGVPSGVACSAASLHDAFPPGKLDRQWANTQVNNCDLVANDGLTMMPLANGFGCALAAAEIYDLRGASIVIEIPSVPALQELDIQLLPIIPDHIFGFTVTTSGILQAMTYSPQAIYKAATYDPAMHRFFRISAMGDRVDWDVSADGVIFTPFANTIDLKDAIDRVGLMISLSGSVSMTPMIVRRIN